MNVLTECLAQGTSPVGVVSFAKEYLKQQGFEELYYNKMISPKENSKYYIAPFPDVLFAFTTGAGKEMIQSLRMAFAHVEQPCFKVKGKPDFKSMGCAMLNVEVYGGMMDHTWFDRPLGLAGTIVLKGEDVFNPIEVTYDSKRPVALIPGLAIHMQREANNGWKIDRQKELMPLMGLANGRWTEDAFLHFLAEELSVDESEILSYEKFIENLRGYLLDALNLQEKQIYFEAKDEEGMTPNGDRLFVECRVSSEGKEVCGIHTEELYEDYLDGVSIDKIGDTVTEEIKKLSKAGFFEKTKNVNNYSKVKEDLFIRLLNKKKHERALENAVYKEVDGIA